MQFLMDVSAGHCPVGEQAVANSGRCNFAAASLGQIRRLLVATSKAHEQAAREADDDDPGEMVRVLAMAHAHAVATALELARLIHACQDTLPTEQCAWDRIVTDMESMAAAATRMSERYKLHG